MLDKTPPDLRPGPPLKVINEDTTPSVYFNWQDWLPYLEGYDIPKDQQREFIEALWLIVLSFIDLGLPVTGTKQICGQQIDLKAALENAVLSSEPIHPPPVIESEAAHD